MNNIGHVRSRQALLTRGPSRRSGLPLPPSALYTRHGLLERDELRHYQFPHGYFLLTLSPRSSTAPPRPPAPRPTWHGIAPPRAGCFGTHASARTPPQSICMPARSTSTFKPSSRTPRKDP